MIERETHTTYEQRLKERGSGERVTDTGKWRETEREGEGAIKGK